MCSRDRSRARSPEKLMTPLQVTALPPVQRALAQKDTPPLLWDNQDPFISIVENHDTPIVQKFYELLEYTQLAKSVLVVELTSL